MQIFQFLAEDGFEGSYNTVRRHVAQVRPPKRQTFLDLSLEPGEAARQAGTFVAAMCTYTGLDLLCIDELGFLPIDQRGADLLFQVISGRYERGSIVLTSNRPFAKWAAIFMEISDGDFRVFSDERRQERGGC